MVSASTFSRVRTEKTTCNVHQLSSFNGWLAS
jgi:hypothetical protein